MSATKPDKLTINVPCSYIQAKSNNKAISAKRRAGKARVYVKCMIKRYQTVSDSTDPQVLIAEMLKELKTELKQAQFNNNWKRAASIEKRIKEIEAIK